MNTHPRDLRVREGNPLLDAAGRQPAAGAQDDYIDLGLLSRAVRRQALVGIVCTLLFGVLAVAYALSLQPHYTSYATILLDEDRAELLDLISEIPSAALRDGTVQSELEVIKSQALALRVVDRLDLTSRYQELVVTPSPVAVAIGSVSSWVSAFVEPEPAVDEAGADAVPLTAEQQQELVRGRVATVLQRNITVQRVDRSYVLAFAYEATSPGLAQEIASAYAQSYLEFGRGANAAATDDAIAWLRDRTDTLRESASAASRRLENYRVDKGLISVGTRLLSEQQLSELMSQLIIAEADASRAAAEAQQARQVIEAGPEAALSNLTATDGGGRDSLSAQLRQQYVEATRQRRRIAEQFGEDHPEAQRLATEIAEVEQLIFDEVTRIAAQANNAYEAQNRRVEALRNGLSEAMSQTITDSGALYELRQLEQTEESYKQLYQSALTRLERTIQQRSVPITAARILTEPDLPQGASSPNKMKYLALALVFGAFVGGGIGLARELGRDKLKDRDDVERYLGLPLIATLNRVPRRGLGRVGKMAGTPSGRQLASTLRAIKHAVDEATARHGPRSVAFISPRSGDGKTMLAVNFAVMLAEHGIDTLLIDANPEGASATKHLRAEGGACLVNLLERDEDERLNDDIVHAGVSLKVVPVAPKDRMHSAAIFAGTDLMVELVQKLSEDVQYVIFDMPPASDGADAHAFANYVQTAVIVNRRARATDVGALAQLTAWRSKAVGIVLNRN